MTRNNKLRAVFLAALMVLWVFAGAVAFTGSTVAQSNLQEASDQADDTWETKSDAWQGQTLYFQPELNPENNTYTIREYDSTDSTSPVKSAIRRVRFSQTDEGDYYAHIDTSDFEGEVVITRNGRTNKNVSETDASGVETGLNGDDGNEAIEFFVQDMDASWSPSSVGQDGTSELDVASGRTESYDVEISSDNLTVGQLQSLFNNQTYTETGNGGIIVPTKSEDLTADFSEIDEEAGDYTFSVDVTDTSASDTATVTVDPDVAADANFDQPVFEEEQGDDATISLQSESLDSFNVTIGNEDDVAYEANLVVTPNEDGEVVISMNTYQAGNWSGDASLEDVFEAQDGSSIDFTHDNTTRVSGTSAPLQTGLYDIVADNGQNKEYDVAALDITERSTDSATVYTAPDYTGVSTLEEVNAGMDEGTVTEDSEIALEDAVLVEVQASGIYGLLGAESNPEGYFGNDTALNMSIVQTNPGPNRQPNTVDLDSSETRVLQDAENDTFYLVLNSDNIQADRDVEAGDEFEVTFEVTDTYEYNDEAESVNDSFSMVERSAEFDTQGGEVVVPASENAEISGTSSVAPGTDLTIRARATGENPFLKTSTATVSEDGTFSAEMDFTDVESEQEFTVTIPNEDFDAETPGRVGEVDRAAVSLSDVSATEGEEVSSITVDSAFLPNGGFVTIHDGSLTDGATFDSVRGTSDYLSEGEHSDVEVSLDEPYTEDGEAIAMPHEDTNDNEEYDFVDTDGDDDGAYTDENGDAVVDSASVTFEPESTPTDTDDDDTTTDTDTDTTTDEDGDDGEDQAGFGAIVALIALLGAALLAARRNAF